MARIKFSFEAMNDLQEIKKYIREDLCNEKAAVDIIAKIMANIRVLADFPKSGPSLSLILGFPTGYRYLICGNYNAFYRIENDTIYIVRVLYCRRNFMQILFGSVQDWNWMLFNDISPSKKMTIFIS